MRLNNLLLAQFTGSQPAVSTLEKNQRWCPGRFKIACDTGERRCAFVLPWIIVTGEVIPYACYGGYLMAHRPQTKHVSHAGYK